MAEKMIKSMVVAKKEVAVKRDTRCDLCCKKIIDGVHEGGICDYRVMIEQQKEKGEIIIMA